MRYIKEISQVSAVGPAPVLLSRAKISAQGDGGGKTPNIKSVVYTPARQAPQPKCLCSHSELSTLNLLAKSAKQGVAKKLLATLFLIESRITLAEGNPVPGFNIGKYRNDKRRHLLGGFLYRFD